MGYVYVASTIAFTVYGQIIVKWQLNEAGEFPAGVGAKLSFLLSMMANPWVISVYIGAVIAALSWMAALTQFQLSRVYPFMALSFVLVLVLSVVAFGESLTVAKVLGVTLIVGGLVIGSQP